MLTTENDTFFIGDLITVIQFQLQFFTFLFLKLLQIFFWELCSALKTVTVIN